MKRQSGFLSGMPFVWWGKLILILVGLLFGVLYTIPTFLGDPQTWARHTEGPQKGTPLAFHHRMAEMLLPSSRISLGLDLKGGLHLVLDVEIEKSVRDSIERSLNRAKELSAEKGVIASAITMNADGSASIELDDPSKKDDFVNALSNQTNLARFKSLEGKKLTFIPDSQQITEYSAQVLQQAMNTIRNRIDQFNVSEPSIVQQGQRRIVVQMPGLQDPERAKSLIGNTAQLDFRLVLNEVQPAQLSALIEEARKALNIPEDTKPESVAKLSQWMRDNKKISAQATVMLSRNYENDGKTTKLVSTTPYLVQSQTKLTGDLIENAQSVMSSSSFIPEYAVSLEFKPQGAKLFGELTKEAYDPKNTPHQIAIILDDNVNSAPVVNEPILTGQAQITMGRRSQDPELKMKEAQDLALVLRAGALPATVRIVEERQVGPSEGEENIRKGLLSSALSGGIVIALMIFIYGNAGLVSNIAMLFNVLLTLAFLAAFGATLTLAGIAGIVLTMAVAVDGNVIINERIREELRHGLTTKQAFYKGYNHSFGTLIDAHVTSAVAGLVLLVYGNPAVKGFAVTLLCGIISTLFTSYYVTEVIGQWVVEKTKIKRFG